MGEPIEVLRAARAKIADPEHWTRGDFARDAEGNPVAFSAPEAFCWCARGAIYAVDEYDGWSALQLLRRAINEQVGSPAVDRFNNTHEHSEVLAAFDRAIEIGEGRS